MRGIGAAYSSRSDFDSVSETPAPNNFDPDLASEATDPIASPVESEASTPRTGEETAKASTVVKEPAATADSQSQEMDSKTAAGDRETAGAKESKPEGKNPEPAEEKAESKKKEAKPAEKVSKSEEGGPKPAEDAAKSVEKETKPAEKAAKSTDGSAQPADKVSKSAEKDPKPAEKAAKPAPKPKPQKPEDKPFPEFIDTLFLPAVVEQLKSNDITAERLERVEGDRPVVGGSCPMVIGELPGGRRFWLCFAKEDINSQKVIALADPGSEPTLLESFLIDEKRTSLALLVSRLLQRLNGQKWLGGN